jgi:serine/threonine protein kinase
MDAVYAAQAGVYSALKPSDSRANGAGERLVQSLSRYAFSPLRDGDLALYRGSGTGLPPILLVAAENNSRACLRRLEHEYEIATQLDAAGAVIPLSIARHEGRMVLILEDPGGEPLDQVLERNPGQPLDLTRFLRIAIPLTTAVRRIHEHGLIHKDIKPANILVDEVSGGVRLMGFGIASRLPRERRDPEAPEVIAGTFAYMAPEQTGRMNRSIDARSDLYSLGVTLYQLLTGHLPFAADDPLEWIHCHIARQPTAPSDRAAVPELLSSLVMKLLAKSAEEGITRTHRSLPTGGAGCVEQTADPGEALRA